MLTLETAPLLIELMEGLESFERNLVALTTVTSGDLVVTKADPVVLFQTTLFVCLSAGE